MGRGSASKFEFLPDRFKKLEMVDWPLVAGSVKPASAKPASAKRQAMALAKCGTANRTESLGGRCKKK